jgi:hypothetical protein
LKNAGSRRSTPLAGSVNCREAPRACCPAAYDRTLDAGEEKALQYHLGRWRHVPQFRVPAHFSAPRGGTLPRRRGP